MVNAWPNLKNTFFWVPGSVQEMFAHFGEKPAPLWASVWQKARVMTTQETEGANKKLLLLIVFCYRLFVAAKSKQKSASNDDTRDRRGKHETFTFYSSLLFELQSPFCFCKVKTKKRAQWARNERRTTRLKKITFLFGVAWFPACDLGWILRDFRDTPFLWCAAVFWWLLLFVSHTCSRWAVASVLPHSPRSLFWRSTVSHDGHNSFYLEGYFRQARSKL